VTTELSPTEPDVEFEFGHDETAPSGARHALERLFPVRDRFAEDVQLATSELVTNVIRHTDDGGRMRAWDNVPLRVEVYDLNPILPAPPDYADERGGHGLRVVERVSDRWGAHPDADGKIVWAEFSDPADRSTSRS
jgi:anti-sigma regulatory factor (Ser/Thr protein kinase)